MRILGLVGATHDSGMAILDDGRIELVIEEERLKREKRTKNFPRFALTAALGADGAGLDDIDVLVTPWDEKRLQRSFAKAVLGHFPLSLTLLSERSHTPQRNEIAILNHLPAAQAAARFSQRQAAADSSTSVITTAMPPRSSFRPSTRPTSSSWTATATMRQAACIAAAATGWSGAGTRLLQLASAWSTRSSPAIWASADLDDEGKVMALAAYGGRSLRRSASAIWCG